MDTIVTLALTWKAMYALFLIIQIGTTSQQRGTVTHLLDLLAIEQKIIQKMHTIMEQDILFTQEYVEASTIITMGIGLTYPNAIYGKILEVSK
jgi:hypothetical protein